jgi:hypothetical protein
MAEHDGVPLAGGKTLQPDSPLIDCNRVQGVLLRNKDRAGRVVPIEHDLDGAPTAGPGMVPAQIDRDCEEPRPDPQIGYALLRVTGESLVGPYKDLLGYVLSILPAWQPTPGAVEHQALHLGHQLGEGLIQVLSEPTPQSCVCRH